MKKIIFLIMLTLTCVCFGQDTVAGLTAEVTFTSAVNDLTGKVNGDFVDVDIWVQVTKGQTAPSGTTELIGIFDLRIMYDSAIFTAESFTWNSSETDADAFLKYISVVDSYYLNQIPILTKNYSFITGYTKLDLSSNYTDFTKSGKDVSTKTKIGTLKLKVLKDAPTKLTLNNYGIGVIKQKGVEGVDTCTPVTTGELAFAGTPPSITVGAITVKNSEPADITTIAEGGLVKLNATNVQYDGGALVGATYVWKLYDASNVLVNGVQFLNTGTQNAFDGTTPAADFIAPGVTETTKGTYKVELTVSKEGVGSKTFDKVNLAITDTNIAPTANAQKGSTAGVITNNEKTVVTLDAGNSEFGTPTAILPINAAGNTIESYTWTEIDANGAKLTTGSKLSTNPKTVTSATITFEADELTSNVDKIRYFKVAVTDNGGLSSTAGTFNATNLPVDFVKVVIKNVNSKPVGTIARTPAQDYVTEKAFFTLAGSVTDADTTDTHTYQWKFVQEEVMITESYPFDTTSAIYKVLSAMKTTPKTTQSINVQAPPYTSDYKTDWPSAVGLKFQLIAKDQLGLTSEVKEVTIGITKESSTVTDLITGASNEITDTGTLTTTTFPTLTGSTSENTTYSADSAVSTTPYVPAGNTLVPTTIVLVPQTGVTVENFANTDPTSLSKETGFPTTSFGGATVVKMQVPADGKAKSIILTFDKAIPSDYVLFKKFKKTGDTEVKWHNYEAMTGEKRVIWSGDRKKVIVLVRDTEFDWGDAGTTAGVIEDPIIFGQSADTVLESVSKDDCFINSSKNSDGWMIIAILAMLGCCVVLKRKAC